MKLKKSISIVLLLGLISFVSAHAGEEDYGYHMNGMMGGTLGVGGMFFGWVFIFLVTITLVLFIIWLIKQIEKK